MKLRFLTEPALLIGKTLVITDLHLGIEQEILRSGITVPSQVIKIEERIDKLIKSTKADHLVILGDLKHQVTNITWQEYKEIPLFFEHFSNIDVSIVMGNHDGDIGRLAPKDVKVYGPAGFKMGEFLLLHGHAWPDEKDIGAKYIVMGHVHPAVEFFTKNFRSVEPCWLKCEVDNSKFKEKFKKKTKFEQGIIMPSFNRMIGGMAFNSKDFVPLGPLLRNDVLKWESADVFLLDGTLIGSLDELKRN